MLRSLLTFLGLIIVSSTILFAQPNIVVLPFSNLDGEYSMNYRILLLRN